MNKTIDFLQLFVNETAKSPQWFERRQQEIAKHGFVATTEELTFAAKVAWRNSNKCIGRLFWQSLHVIDARHCVDEHTVFEQLLHHIVYATNDGKIRPTVTVFNETRVRIWNHQLIRYAGYEQGGDIIGDPSSVQFTKQCIALGWQPRYGKFDVLPLVVQIDERPPQWFHIPSDYILEVPITHPQYDFAPLQLKWYAVPIISNMRFEVGEQSFHAAPFNGWYMGTEIGARNFADESRYNVLPQVAKLLELDTSKQATLWKDRALVELNVAVLHSFKENGVSIVDHHTAAAQFQLFESREKEAGRDVTGNWAWLIPPMSPATTHVFHQPYDNAIKTPNYFYTTDVLNIDAMKAVHETM